MKRLWKLFPTETFQPSQSFEKFPRFVSEARQSQRLTNFTLCCPVTPLARSSTADPMVKLKISRRDFVSRAAILTGALTAGLRVQGLPAAEPPDGTPLRVVFATDAHLMVNDQLRSNDGLIAALSAIENLKPKADLILFGRRPHERIARPRFSGRRTTRRRILADLERSHWLADRFHVWKHDWWAPNPIGEP